MNQIFPPIKFIHFAFKKVLFLLIFLNLIYVAIIAQPGKDGAITITAANTVVNRYTRVTADVIAGNNTITVTDISELNRDAIGYLPAGFVTNTSVYASNAIGVGDLIILYQAQGAVINSTNTVAYGQVTNYKGAGSYELAYVESILGNTITIGCKAKLSYFAASYVQVIRIPQYTTLTVNAASSIVAIPWGDSSFGGVDPSALARRRGGFVTALATNIINNGSINANTAGFRGGIIENFTSVAGPAFYTNFNTPNKALSAEKGESIAGYREDYDLLYGGRYGRGAPANGGGGGNAHNAGGGGGANGGNPLNWFRGAGVMNEFGTCGIPGAWALDPNYIANGNALTNSAGGGSGGYTYGYANVDACTIGPSYPAGFISAGVPAADVLNTAWGGDERDAMGGLGGRPIVSANMQNQVFFGGGGGAGDGNNNANTDGGEGGGIVFLITLNNITGAGTIQANGENGPNTVSTHRDAPGGGGGGGTVLIQANTIANTINLNSNGGSGGNQLITDYESEGPGGGGGGGVISVNAVTDNSVKTITGGKNGSTSSISLTEFPPNGATSGSAGTTTAIVVNLNFLICNADLQITKTASNANPTIGTNVTFTITALNNGPADATAVSVNDALPAGYTIVSASTSAGTWTAPTWTIGNLVNGASAILTVIATVNPTGSYANTATITSSNNPDPNLANNTVTNTPLPNKAPVAMNDVANTTSDKNVTINVAGNDTDSDGTLVLNSIDLDPSTAGQQTTLTVAGQGTYTANLNGTVTFTPLLTFNGVATPVGYTITDNNGGVSNIATISVTVAAPGTYIIGGTVLNDGNGLADNQVNGPGSNAGGINAVLVDLSTGNVAAVATVHADGIYSFVSIVAGNYSILITTTFTTVGNPAPAVILPAGWVNTGENLGAGSGSDGLNNGILALGTVNVNISNALFGIEQPPISNDVTAAGQINPTGNGTIIVPTLTGTDAEQGGFYGVGNGDTIVIKTVPTNGTLFYNGQLVLAGDTIKNYNPALLILDPNDGLITVTFTFTEIDAANIGSAVSGTVNIIFSSSLPVHFISFTATQTTTSSILKWSTAQEINSNYFLIERSADGVLFKSIGKVKANGNSNVQVDYNFTDDATLTGRNFYRLKLADLDGKIEYSEVKMVKFDKSDFVIVYPNPSVNQLKIKFSGYNWINKSALINVLTAEGKLVFKKRIGILNQVETLNISNFSTGYYIIQIISGSEVVSKPIQIRHQ